MFCRTALFTALVFSTANAEGRHLLGNLIPQNSLFVSASGDTSWNPDIEYSQLSMAAPYDSISDHRVPDDGSQIQIPYCNNYALNGGSILYTPCSANYLVAAHTTGVILPPNMCGGQMCPSAGGSLVPGNTDAQTCSEMSDYITGAPLSPSTTTLFDQYCLHPGSQGCGSPVGNGAQQKKSRFFELSPPIFTISTNWCDASSAGRTRKSYPTIASFLQDATVTTQQFCPADTTGGYSNTPGPSPLDVVVKVCLPGCQKIEKPIVVTMNMSSIVPRKGNGEWYWKVGIWDSANKAWYVLCDSSRTNLIKSYYPDTMETLVAPSDVNKYIDPTSSCIVFAPITNYKNCPGRPFVGLSNSEAAAIAALSVFGVMLLLQILVCCCCVPKAKLLIQPPQKQIVYVEAPLAVPRIVERVVEKVVPQPMMMQVVGERVVDDKLMYQTLNPQGLMPQGYTTVQMPPGGYGTAPPPGFAAGPMYPTVAQLQQ